MVTENNKLILSVDTCCALSVLELIYILNLASLPCQKRKCHRAARIIHENWLLLLPH